MRERIYIYIWEDGIYYAGNIIKKPITHNIQKWQSFVKYVCNKRWRLYELLASRWYSRDRRKVLVECKMLFVCLWLLYVCTMCVEISKAFN